MTSDLVVRSAPGVGADSEIQTVTLSAPSVVYVIDGPAPADGYVWYLVDPARAPWTLGDVPTAGWVAAAAKDGELWIGPHELDCEDDPTIEDLVTIAPQMALYCYAERTLTVDAIAHECGTVVGSGLLWSRVCQLFIPGQDPESMPQGCVDVCAPWIEVWFNDLTPPADGALVTVIGHFDDADVQHCAGAGGGAAPLAVHRCRLAFVATGFRGP